MQSLLSGSLYSSGEDTKGIIKKKTIIDNCNKHVGDQKAEDEEKLKRLRRSGIQKGLDRTN